MTNITKFEIDMLDVKAADAFLIHAFVKNALAGEDEYVVLVDAGNECDGEKIIKHINKYYKKKNIDLAIITHCDADHYGGMKYLIEEHNNDKSSFRIGKVWIHDPYQHVDVDDVKYVRKNETLRARLNAAYAFSNGTSLLDALCEANINKEEVFSDSKYDPLNICVLGPDKDYYESLIPDFRVDLDFIKEQVDDEYEEKNNELLTESKFYSNALANAPDDKSKVNQSSIVFRLVVGNETYLFTGDAGREALHRIINNDKKNSFLKNISWMKVPHHGSKHNLDNEIIEYFHPKVSYISTEKYGKFASRCTIHALKKVGSVYSTHVNHANYWHHRGTDARTEYSPAQSL